MSTLQVNTIENRSGERFDLGGGNKNLLINGGMNVWQRNTTATVTGAYHTADRWETSFTGLGTFTQSRSTDVPSGQGFGYSLKMDCTAADASPAASDKMFIEQKIEGQNLQHLLKSTSNAKKVTLSFWVKSNKTGTYVVKFETTGGRFISKAYTIDSSLTWEKKTITVEGDTGGSAIANDNTEGLGVQWWLGAGSNFTTSLQGTWAVVTDDNIAQGQVNLADSTSNEWYMTGCQLEVGSQATNFEFEPYESTYLKCLRYNYRLENTAGSVFVFVASGVVNTTTTSFGPVTMVHPLRVKPDLTYSNLSHFDIERSDLNPTAITIFGSATGLSPGIQWNHSTMTVGEASILTLDAVGWINFDAEL